MKSSQIIHFFIENAEEGGYIARAVNYPIFTQGETLDELVQNIKEATELHFEEIEQNALPITVNFSFSTDYAKA